MYQTRGCCLMACGAYFCWQLLARGNGSVAACYLSSTTCQTHSPAAQQALQLPLVANARLSRVDVDLSVFVPLLQDKCGQ